MNYARFLAHVVVYHGQNPQQRMGQALLNVLRIYTDRDDLLDRIMSTGRDPWECDDPEQIGEFLKWLRKEW